MIRAPQTIEPGHELLVSATLLTQLADTHDVGTTIIGDREYAIIRTPGQDTAVVYYALCPEAVAS